MRAMSQQEGEIERLTDMVDDVIAGRFSEAIEIPLCPSWVLVGEKRGSGRLTMGETQRGPEVGLIEVGWEKWTPKSDKLERRRCQDEEGPARKV